MERKGHRYELNVTGRNLEKLLLEQYSSELKNLDLIKIDPEGYGMEIVKTIPNILDRFKPNIIFECYPGLSLAEKEELFDAVARHEYQIFFLTDFMNGFPREIMRHDTTSTKDVFDVMGTPASSRQYSISSAEVTRLFARSCSITSQSWLFR